MRKKIFIGIGVLVVVLAATFLYLNNRNRTLSPPGSTELSINDLSVSVEYSRPSVRERLIFGTEADGALLPYGVYWRMGANEPTLLAVNKDFQLNGISMDAGSYDIYAIPFEDGFEIRLNTAERGWGYTEPDYSLDVLKTKVPFTKLGSPVEQFTINTEEGDNGIKVICSWSDRQWEILITS